ncbi:thioredoxin family protein [Curtobacterium herbarum]|uniref:Thioredoxin domain-containing protein n=1 Tax=Curtobacterium herbarum TaxID=150122 RepID=A0ABP4K7V7_9MICO|nr:thioredoxin family protein [Curtobacterium herbarum]MBM7475877.1 thioredoxin-like negative regulator of GroEL [Curtobacterium herbarum]MCS6543787.1 thioredoxin family protein [Curtobacterium herbarum]
MTVALSLAIVAGVLALATALGLLLRSRTGRARVVTSKVSDATTVADLADREAFGTAATLLQFSTPTCARCPATARQLDAVAASKSSTADGPVRVRRLEIDLAERPELARRFDVMQTPTVLLVDGTQTVRARFGGPPRQPELIAALDAVLTEEHS